MHVINDTCVACGTCAEACPAGAIAMDDNLGRYAVSDACVDCGACEDACPVGAIAAE